jgi:hypothetical protein
MLNEVITKADTAQATADAALPKAGGTMTGDLTLNVNAGKVIVNRPSPGVGNENGRWEGRANNSGYISGIRSFVPADQPGVDRVAAAIFTTTYTSSLQTGIDRLIVDPDGRVTTPYQPAFHAIGNGGTFSGGNTITFGSLFQVPSQRSSGFANSRFTAPVSGMYQFNFVAYDFGALVGANFQVFINGGQFAPSDHFQYIKVSDHTMINWSFAQYLTKNDYIQMGFRSGSPSITLYGGHTFWSGYLVG